MKITINLKDPDGIFDALHDAGLIDECGAVILEDELFEIEKFVTFCECIDIEIDTSTGEAKVLKTR
jgi:hypothetical protein